MYQIIFSPEFEKKAKKILSKEELKQLDNILEKISLLGDRLYKNLKEIKFSGKRVYYLTYENYLLVLLVSVSNKKNQQSEIDKIKVRLDIYEKYIFDFYEEK